MKGYRARKLAPKSRRGLGYRLIKSGSSRILLQLLPGHKAKAVEILTPVKKGKR